MFETLRSPFAPISTSSFSVLPSEPGAPPGHNRIASGSTAQVDQVKSNMARLAVDTRRRRVLGIRWLAGVRRGFMQGNDSAAGGRVTSISVLTARFGHAPGADLVR